MKASIDRHYLKEEVLA